MVYFKFLIRPNNLFKAVGFKASLLDFHNFFLDLVVQWPAYQTGTQLLVQSNEQMTLVEIVDYCNYYVFSLTLKKLTSYKRVEESSKNIFVILQKLTSFLQITVCNAVEFVFGECLCAESMCGVEVVY